VEPTRLRPLRPLGIVQVVASPFLFLSAWMGVSIVAGIIGNLLRPGISDWGRFDILNAVWTGGALWPLLVAEAIVVVWICVGLIRERQSTAAPVKWLSIALIASSLTGLVLDRGRFWTRPNPYRPGLSISLSLIATVVPLVWHLFVLWYLRGYPWRWQKAAASSQPLPART